MTTSQNGWATITPDECRKWIIPGTGRHLILNPSHAGFVLVWWALFWHHKIERIDLGVWDEWGWAQRLISGSTTITNHNSGTATDLNATRHPLGVPVEDTFTPTQLRRIRRRLRLLFGVLRWGGDYVNRPDGMHTEINATPDRVRILAFWLARTPRGRHIVKANPGYHPAGRK